MDGQGLQSGCKTLEDVVLLTGVTALRQTSLAASQNMFAGYEQRGQVARLLCSINIRLVLKSALVDRQTDKGKSEDRNPIQMGQFGGG